MRDEQLVKMFEDGSLPVADFGHEQHVRLAFLYVCRYPLLEVLARFPANLKRYAAAHGKHGLATTHVTAFHAKAKVNPRVADF